MKVKNIVVNEKKVYLDILIRELIKHNISYVFIDNFEIHFDDYIVRLYDVEDLKEQIILGNMDALIDESDKNPHFIQTIEGNNYELFKSKSKMDFIKEAKPKYTKRLIKQENKLYSNKVNTRRK